MKVTKRSGKPRFCPRPLNFFHFWEKVEEEREEAGNTGPKEAVDVGDSVPGLPLLTVILGKLFYCPRCGSLFETWISSCLACYFLAGLGWRSKLQCVRGWLVKCNAGCTCQVVVVAIDISFFLVQQPFPFFSVISSCFSFAQPPLLVLSSQDLARLLPLSRFQEGPGWLLNSISLDLIDLGMGRGKSV